MPFKSRAQAAYFNANRKKLEAQGVDVDEWNKATDFSSLPERSKVSGNSHWMEDESKREKHAGTKGSFSAAAARAGEPTRQYAEENQNAPGKKGRKARMTLVYMGAKH